MKLPIYLDYAATTPVDPRVAVKMQDYLTIDGVFGNPASRTHSYGWQAEEAVETARQQVAEVLNCDPLEIIWTSGATESNNLAIKGVAYSYLDRGRHIVTSQIEHKSVLDSCRYLEQQGFAVSCVKPQPNGLIDPADVMAAVRKDTVLVSIMQVNNEIGTINDIAAIGKKLREKSILFHVDAAQSAGKLVINLKDLAIDLLSLSAHKIYGPKGIGALYVRRNPSVELQPLIHGGGHEKGLRSGTLATHQIVAMGEALQLAQQEMSTEQVRVTALKQKLWEGVQQIPDVYLNGQWDQSVAGILNVSFGGVDGETLLLALNDLAVASGSACTSIKVEPSYVLRALGIAEDLAYSAIRFSLGRYTTEMEISHSIQHLQSVVNSLRQTQRK